MYSLDEKQAKQRLAEYIKQLPSESVAALATTDDQIKELSKCRKFNQRVGNCWRERHSGGHDPLFSLIDQGEISENEHRQIYFLIRFFESLWGVVYQGWPQIEAELGNENQFNSAQHLFEAILRVWFDNDFAVCLEPHWGLTKAGLYKSSVAIKDYADSQLKRTEVNSDLTENIRSLTHTSSHMGNPWLILALSICNEKATKNKALRDQLDDFYTQIIKFAEFGADWSKRKRGSKAMPLLKTIHWINGKRFS